MPFWVFLLFEITFTLLIVSYAMGWIKYKNELFMHGFILLMLLNAADHIVWSLTVDRYVPGLITAPLFVLTFFAYQFHLVRSAKI